MTTREAEPIATTVTSEDVVWAHRVLFARDPEPAHAERLRVNVRTPLALLRNLTRSPAMSDERRRRRLDRQLLDANLVRWAYRIIRFESIDLQTAEAEVAKHGILSRLVDHLLGDEEQTRALQRAAPRWNPSVRMLFSKSMPRSGHHLLAQMLGEYYGAAWAYCEFYGGGDECCHTIPCVQPFQPLLQNRLFLQKSHDFQFTDPLDQSGAYIVQYRHPIPRLQSNYDHNRQITGHSDTWDYFVRFAEAETTYFIRFWDKWLRTPHSHTFALVYEELMGDPMDAMKRLLRFIDADVDVQAEALERALAVMTMPSGSTRRKERPETRDVTSYRHYDREFYERLEARVFAACEGLTLPRLFVPA